MTNLRFSFRNRSFSRFLIILSILWGGRLFGLYCVTDRIVYPVTIVTKATGFLFGAVEMELFSCVDCPGIWGYRKKLKAFDLTKYLSKLFDANVTITKDLEKKLKH